MNGIRQSLKTINQFDRYRLVFLVFLRDSNTIMTRLLGKECCSSRVVTNCLLSRWKKTQDSPIDFSEDRETNPDDSKIMRSIGLHGGENVEKNASVNFLVEIYQLLLSYFMKIKKGKEMYYGTY